MNGTCMCVLYDRAYVTTRPLRSSKDCRLAVPTPRTRQSRLFSCVVPRWWNELPSPVYIQETLEDPALQTASPILALTLYFPLCLHSISTPLTEPD